MSKSAEKRRGDQEEYAALLRALQIELVMIQKHIIEHVHRVLVTFEGRDEGGKTA